MVREKNIKYGTKLNEYLDKYNKILTIEVTNVGSKKISQTRSNLRKENIHILMGKNTLIRKVLRDRMTHLESSNPEAAVAVASIVKMVVGNIGFLFVPKNVSIAELRAKIINDKVQTQVKAGVIAPTNVIIPAGPTGQDPSQTSFFQALDIPTKINRGQIEIVDDVKLVNKNEKVSRSAAELLVMLDIKPFYYGIGVNLIYDNGNVYHSEVLDITEDDVTKAFNCSIREAAALCLALEFPTAISVPHHLLDAYKNMLAIGLNCGSYTWNNLTKLKENLNKKTEIIVSIKKKNVDKTVIEEESSTVADALFASSNSSNENST